MNIKLFNLCVNVAYIMFVVNAIDRENIKGMTMIACESPPRLTALIPHLWHKDDDDPQYQEALKSDEKMRYYACAILLSQKIQERQPEFSKKARELFRAHKIIYQHTPLTQHIVEAREYLLSATQITDELIDRILSTMKTLPHPLRENFSIISLEKLEVEDAIVIRRYIDQLVSFLKMCKDQISESDYEKMALGLGYYHKLTKMIGELETFSQQLDATVVFNSLKKIEEIKPVFSFYLIYKIALTARSAISDIVHDRTMEQNASNSDGWIIAHGVKQAFDHLGKAQQKPMYQQILLEEVEEASQLIRSFRHNRSTAARVQMAQQIYDEAIHIKVDDGANIHYPIPLSLCIRVAHYLPADQQADMLHKIYSNKASEQ